MNTYVLARNVLNKEGETIPRSQVPWREGIIAGLLADAKNAQNGTLVHPKERISHRKRALPDDEECEHVQVKIPQKDCVYCRGMRQGDRPCKRMALGQLADANNRAKARHVTSFGCKQCGVALCVRRNRGCFERWHRG